METSLPHQYHDYQRHSSSRFFLPQTYSTYTHQMPACQYQQPLFDWQSPSPMAYRYQSLSGSHNALQAPRLRFHMPAYRYSQPPQRGQATVHTITNMSPPALTRCVATLPYPFIADHTPTVTQSQDTRPVQCLDCVSTHQTTRRVVGWLDCSLMERRGLQDVAGLHSDHICRSLIDTSQKPSALNDAVCMYIDYLTRDNDRIVGDLSEDLRLHTTLSTVTSDELYRDVFCQSSSFPTSRFREWLQIYSVDLEITDPQGRRLTEAKFPGCGCDAHQVTDRLMNDWSAVYGGNKSTATAQLSRTRTRWNDGCGLSQSDVSSSSMNARREYNCSGRRGRRGGGRCVRRRGRRSGSKRKSSTERLQQIDDESSDDSAVVAFLASLQSNAVKRRCQQQMTSYDVESQSQDKVIEEVVDDELHLDECRVPNSVDLQQFNLPTLTKHHFTSESYPDVSDCRCAVPATVVDVDVPGNDVEKSSEQ